MKILVTGAAGFIGSFVSKKLLEDGHQILGIDNLSNYYDVRLKKARLQFLKPFRKFEFKKIDISDQKKITKAVIDFKPKIIIHLAAQAGVRYSLIDPYVYGDANLRGFLNLIEVAKQIKPQHFVYASTSSVYGLNRRLPFSPHDHVDHPASLYAATKRANELIAHSYSHMFDLPTTGLRFFTVYGPFGRPDMALFIFTKNILTGKPIDVFNHGKHKRDFTYVDDIVESVCRVSLSEPPLSNPGFDLLNNPDPSLSSAPFRILNIGNTKSVELTRYIELLEKYLGKKAIRKNKEFQRGDVLETEANIDDTLAITQYQPQTDVETGIKNFVDWYRGFYKI